MSDDDNKVIFRRVIEEGYNKGNSNALDELFASDFADHQAGISPPTLEGIKGFIRNPEPLFQTSTSQ